MCVCACLCACLPVGVCGCVGVCGRSVAVAGFVWLCVCVYLSKSEVLKSGSGEIRPVTYHDLNRVGKTSEIVQDRLYLCLLC